MLRVAGFTYAYPGASVPALADVSLELRSGECLCLTGASGCGKSTLLLAIQGLLRGSNRSGAIELGYSPTGEGSQQVGLVFQNPESRILCTTVAEEVAFGPENFCVPSREIASRVRRCLREVGLAGTENRNVERFSAGQKQRLAIAAALATEPKLLLLDEPSSQLDRQGKADLAGVLGNLKAQGYSLLVAEHDPQFIAPLIDRYLSLEQGRVVAASGQQLPSVGVHPAQQRRAASAELSVRVADLSFSCPETGPVLRKLSFQLQQGEKIHLFGSNGAGKSTLLRCLAGLERDYDGTVEMTGIGVPRPELLPGKVGVLFQNPARQLFNVSVREEVAFTLKRLGLQPAEINRLVDEALALCNISHLAERAPLTLSFGEQHRVALASVMAPRPDLLLLDEPFAGLDLPQRLSLLAILAEMPARYGTTVLLASHDELPDSSWADRSLQLEGGIIAEKRL